MKSSFVTSAKKAALKGVAVVSMACALVGLMACSSSKQENAQSSTTSQSESGYTLVTKGHLTVVAELGFQPFEYLEGSSTTPVGFDVDLITEIAKRLNLEVTYLPNQKFDTLIPTIKQGGKADVAIAGITITDERSQEVDFTTSYLDSNQSLVVKSGSTETEQTLNDASKKVVVQTGTSGEDWAKENLPNATIVSVDDVAAAMAGVQTGLYDAMVIDLPVASNLISTSYSDLTIAKEIPTGEQYGIAVSKDNPALTEAINK
ncbi:MAG: amino acid ABC transporter substrate-binding protein, partial [Atopobium sp.]|nr:amino acid ABC transporter substrate-binding protein [Atopobium sp.]